MADLEESHKALNKISCDMGRFADEKRREIKFLRDRIKQLEEDNKRLTNCLMDAQTLWERPKPKIVGVEVGLARNELNKIIGRTI